jgi:hypothetical protein
MENGEWMMENGEWSQELGPACPTRGGHGGRQGQKPEAGNKQWQYAV